MTNNFTPINFLFKKSVRSAKTKESEPILRGQEHFNIKEAVEHEVEKEVKPFVSLRQETIKLPPDIKKIGVNASQTTSFPSYQNIKLPIDDNKVLIGLNAPISSSFRWLAELAVYILRIAHLQLKKIHGRVVRVRIE